MNPQIRLLAAGDSAIVAEFGNTVDMSLNALVQALRKKIESAPFTGFRETVPTYRSLAICFDPIKTDVLKLEEKLKKMIENLDAADSSEKTVVTIPTCYLGDYAPDMKNVADHTKLSVDEIIKRHSSVDCYCYMLGFTPGFPYLGGMDETLATPRLKEPRELITAGSVGIANKQTGIYSVPSPGGWQLIGRTPLKIFDADRNPPIFLKAGMWVRFKPISEAEFADIEKTVLDGTWRPEVQA